MRDFKDLFIVDKISGIDPDNNTKGPLSALKFRVAWKGYPNQDTWEGWKQVRNLEQFREFLENNPKKSYRDLLKRLGKQNKQNENGKSESRVSEVSESDTQVAIIPVTNESDKQSKEILNATIGEGVKVGTRSTEKIRLGSTKRKAEMSSLSEGNSRRGKGERKRSWKLVGR